MQLLFRHLCLIHIMEEIRWGHIEFMHAFVEIQVEFSRDMHSEESHIQRVILVITL